MSSVLNPEINPDILDNLRHPWQPSWVILKEDVNVFLELMDSYRYLSDNEKDWYPPYIVFIENFNGKQMIGTIKSTWCGYYDPFAEGKRNPQNIIGNSMVKI